MEEESEWGCEKRDGNIHMCIREALEVSRYEECDRKEAVYYEEQ